MKRVFGILTGSLLVLAVASPAAAQFGLPIPNPMRGLGTSGSRADVDGFLVRARTAELLTRISADSIYAAVESQSKAEEILARRKANASISDPKERDAADRKLDAEVDATLATVDWDAEQKALQEQQNADRTKHLGVSIYNFALAVLKDEEVVTTGREIVSSITSNPMQAMTMAGKLGAVKDSTYAIGSQMGNLTRIAGGIPKLMTVAKVTELPASASATPMPVAE
jgi:hypothetical protein